MGDQIRATLARWRAEHEARSTKHEGAEWLQSKVLQGTLAQRLGDGESAAIALTAKRLPVVLDENKARALVRQKPPAVHYGSTLSVMFAAATRAGWPVERVQQLVISARMHARMGVPRDKRQLLDRLMDGVVGWPVGRTRCAKLLKGSRANSGTATFWACRTRSTR